MLSTIDFIRRSLELHLFFARIMKEHSFFLETAFTPRDTSYSQRADALRRQFDGLISEAIQLANGVVSLEVTRSGELVTPYTLKSEMASSYYSGVQIPTQITQAEAGLVGNGQYMVNPILEQRVHMLNNRAIPLITALIQFKANILTNVLSCKMFTFNYPLLIDHIMREAKLYLQVVQRLQYKVEVDPKQEAYENETFWNRIMAEHSKFIRGLLDPTENDLIIKANNFANEFDKLTEEAKAAMEKSAPLKKVTDDSLKATKNIRDFKAQGTQGILECKIKSIILPLLADHTLREANHFLRLLKTYER